MLAIMLKVLRAGPAPLTPCVVRHLAQQAFFVGGPLVDLPSAFFRAAYSSGMLANHSR
jgi:hypothetical protein